MWLLLSPQAFLDQRGEDYDDCPNFARLVRAASAYAAATRAALLHVNMLKRMQVQRATECERDSGVKAIKPSLESAAADEVCLSPSTVPAIIQGCTALTLQFM